MNFEEKLMLTGALKSKFSRLPTEVANMRSRGTDINLLASKPCVAIVGTRKPTPYGKNLTQDFVKTLVRAGVVIVSGLAFGVDALAHRTALEFGGQTIAVLPSGLNEVYPASHKHLAEEIAGNGCLISEYEHYHTPRKHDFLHRNRLIAALSDAVFIPEAADRSGSLSTAHHALSMDIQVFAAPGRVDDHMSRGTNKLIQEGRAHLVQSAAELLDFLGISDTNEKVVKSSQFADLLQLIESGIADISELQMKLSIPTNELLISLTSLELEGVLKQDEFGKWHLV